MRRKARVIFIRSHCTMKNMDLFWTAFDWYSSLCWLCQQWHFSQSLFLSAFAANSTPYLPHSSIYLVSFSILPLFLVRWFLHSLPSSIGSSRLPFSSTQKNRRWNAIYLPFRNVLLWIRSSLFSNERPYYNAMIHATFFHRIVFARLINGCLWAVYSFARLHLKCSHSVFFELNSDVNRLENLG